MQAQEEEEKRRTTMVLEAEEAQCERRRLERRSDRREDWDEGSEARESR